MKFATLAIRGISSFIDGVVTIIIIIILLYGLWGIYGELVPIFQATVPNGVYHYKPDDNETGEINRFEELIEKYPDICSWLEIFDTRIDYPVVHSTDNEKYLYTTIEGAFSKAGTIFMDYRNNSMYTDTYSLLYGHHVIDGIMFSDVLKFLEEDYFNEHEWGKLWLPENTFNIHLFAVLQADGYDPDYFNPTLYGEEDTKELYNMIMDKAVHSRDFEFGPDDRIIGLSTCTDTITNGRVILYGFLEEIEYELKEN